MKNICLLISMIAVSVSGASAQVTGDFKDVSFNVSATADGRMKFVASGGTGTLKNESGETIASGGLIDKEGTCPSTGKTVGASGLSPEPVHSQTTPFPRVTRRVSRRFS